MFCGIEYVASWWFKHFLFTFRVCDIRLIDFFKIKDIIFKVPGYELKYLVKVPDSIL